MNENDTHTESDAPTPSPNETTHQVLQAASAQPALDAPSDRSDESSDEKLPTKAERSRSILTRALDRAKENGNTKRADALADAISKLDNL